MTKPEYPMTRSVRALLDHKIAFTPHFYPYADHGGTFHAAACLNVDEHAIIKTLVMETDTKLPLIVLMHGDREISTKQLARVLGVKSVSPCTVEKTERVTGYTVGGISPLGTRRVLPVYVERSILALPRLLINGGKRGFLIEVTPNDLGQVVALEPVDVAIEP
ncbi:MAG: aminoacyl-tRNA deacylase [Anaerolineae bacterium]|nr:aminoacyl-tRNA deacylase [Anaerolineae bacterium]